jgi:polysaccharide biosynthesis/export protein
MREKPDSTMRRSLALLLPLWLAACAAFPHSGPTDESVTDSANQGKALYALVDLDYEMTQKIAANPPTALEHLASASSDAPIDLIAPGDYLAVSVYEAGSAGLFARPSVTTDQQMVQSVSQSSLPRLVVDKDGCIEVPFAGTLHVAGLTPSQAAEVIRKSLLRKTVDPQVSLYVSQSEANTVGLIGAVKSSGHYPLAPYHDRLLDVLETAGGVVPSIAGLQPPDFLVVVDRGTQRAEGTLADIISDPRENIRLAPKDEIRVLERPRKYSVFGAFVASSQTAIADETLTLAAAVARAGGLREDEANAESVMVFRFERPAVAAALGVQTRSTPKGVPIVYRLNYRDPKGLFVANNFEIRADDLVYVPLSRMALAKQFLDFVNEITNVNYDISAKTTGLRGPIIP